eukprot:g1342.t1
MPSFSRTLGLVQLLLLGQSPNHVVRAAKSDGLEVTAVDDIPYHDLSPEETVHLLTQYAGLALPIHFEEGGQLGLQKHLDLAIPTSASVSKGENEKGKAQKPQVASGGDEQSSYDGPNLQELQQALETKRTAFYLTGLPDGSTTALNAAMSPKTGEFYVYKGDEAAKQSAAENEDNEEQEQVDDVVYIGNNATTFEYMLDFILKNDLDLLTAVNSSGGSSPTNVAALAKGSGTIGAGSASEGTTVQSFQRLQTAVGGHTQQLLRLDGRHSLLKTAAEKATFARNENVPAHVDEEADYLQIVKLLLKKYYPENAQDLQSFVKASSDFDEAWESQKDLGWNKNAFQRPERQAKLEQDYHFYQQFSSKYLVAANLGDEPVISKSSMSDFVDGAQSFLEWVLVKCGESLPVEEEAEQVEGENAAAGSDAAAASTSEGAVNRTLLIKISKPCNFLIPELLRRGATVKNVLPTAVRDANLARYLPLLLMSMMRTAFRSYGDEPKQVQEFHHDLRTSYNDDGETLLHFAVEADNLEAIKWLLQFDDGISPAHGGEDDVAWSRGLKKTLATNVGSSTSASAASAGWSAAAGGARLALHDATLQGGKDSPYNVNSWETILRSPQLYPGGVTSWQAAWGHGCAAGFYGTPAFECPASGAIVIADGCTDNCWSFKNDASLCYDHGYGDPMLAHERRDYFSAAHVAAEPQTQALPAEECCKRDTTREGESVTMCGGMFLYDGDKTISVAGGVAARASDYCSLRGFGQPIADLTTVVPTSNASEKEAECCELPSCDIGFFGAPKDFTCPERLQNDQDPTGFIGHTFSGSSKPAGVCTTRACNTTQANLWRCCEMRGVCPHYYEGETAVTPDPYHIQTSSYFRKTEQVNPQPPHFDCHLGSVAQSRDLWVSSEAKLNYCDGRDCNAALDLNACCVLYEERGAFNETVPLADAGVNLTAAELSAGSPEDESQNATSSDAAAFVSTLSVKRFYYCDDSFTPEFYWSEHQAWAACNEYGVYCHGYQFDPTFLRYRANYTEGKHYSVLLSVPAEDIPDAALLSTSFSVPLDLRNATKYLPVGAPSVSFTVHCAKVDARFADRNLTSGETVYYEDDEYVRIWMKKNRQIDTSALTVEDLGALHPEEEEDAAADARDGVYFGNDIAVFYCHHPSVSSSSIPAQLHREHFSSSELDLDAINAEDFDPVLFINKQFPSEKSLQGVEKTIQKLDAVAKNIDAEVTVAIREQAKLGFRAKEDLQEGKQAIFQLIDRVKSVQSKAEQSESLVLEFCRNIKFLDLAKKNLTHTVTGFKRFVMLVSALEQLRRRAAERKYKEASQLLNACEELSLHFLELSKVVHKVHDLLRQKDALLADLRLRVEKIQVQVQA